MDMMILLHYYTTRPPPGPADRERQVRISLFFQSILLSPVSQTPDLIQSVRILMISRRLDWVVLTSRHTEIVIYQVNISLNGVNLSHYAQLMLSVLLHSNRPSNISSRFKVLVLWKLY